MPNAKHSATGQPGCTAPRPVVGYVWTAPGAREKHRLSGENRTHMPTCAVAEFTFNTKSWSKIVKTNLAKVALDYPKKKKA